MHQLLVQVQSLTYLDLLVSCLVAVSVMTVFTFMRYYYLKQTDFLMCPVLLELYSLTLLRGLFVIVPQLFSMHYTLRVLPPSKWLQYHVRSCITLTLVPILAIHSHSELTYLG